MFVLVDYVREMTSNKFCKSGEYGSFEHALFFPFLKFLISLKMFMIVVYVREMTSNKFCKSGEYGSFERALFFCSNF